jgi:hypothetical protein
VNASKAKEILDKFREATTRASGKPGQTSKTTATQTEAAKPSGPCPHGGEHEYDDEACKRCHDPKPGVTGGTTFNVAEFSAPVAKDSLGHDLPAELRQAFEICAEFDAQRAKLTAIKTWMTQRVSHPGAAVLTDAAQRIKSDLDQADAEIKFAKPYCVCVYCKNTGDCTACKGKGWLTEQVYKAAPKGLKREKVAS